MTHPTRKTLVRGSTLGAGVLLALALLVIVNYFGWKYHQHFDWTAGEIHTLSDKTRNILTTLDQPVEIVVFLTPNQGNLEIYEQVRNLVQLYEAASSRISVRFMDPVRNLAEAQQLAERFELSTPNVVVVASGDEKRILLESELAEMDFGGGFGAPSMSSFRGEQLITSAILELAEDRTPKVLFTTGHGERSLDDFGPDGLSTLGELMNLENLEAEEWQSVGQAAVPEDAELVVIAGPTGTFLPPELEMLDAYAATGGRLLVLLDPELSAAGGLQGTGLAEWLAGYGAEVGGDVVVDPENPMPFFGADTFFVTSYGSHPVTRSLQDEGAAVLVSLARSAGTADEVDGELTTTELLFTSGGAWGERNLSNLRAVEKDEDDLAGPVSLGLVVEQELEDGAEEAVEEEPEVEPEDGEAEVVSAEEAASEETASEETASEESASEDSATPARGLRLVVFGDSDFAANRLLQSNAANWVLLADTLNWLVEREEITGIPPKEPEQVRLNLNRAQVRWVWLFSLAILPLASILLGLWIWFQRRR